MKRTIKKCLCLLVVVVMLAGVFCIPTSAAQSIQTDTRYSGYLYAGEKFTASFTPSTTGRYIIESIGDSDTYVELYDSSWNLLSTDDDDGFGNNFRLCTSLTAGRTYYYEIGFLYSDTYGQLTFDFYDTEAITSSRSYSISLSADASSWSKITPSQTSLYTFESTCESDAEIYVYDNQMNEIGYDDDSGSGLNFKLSMSMKAGHTYYIQARFVSSNTSGTLTFNVYDGLYRLSANSSDSAYIEAGDAAWASFVPGRTTCYTIGSYNADGDTTVALYNANGKLIAESDDYNSSSDFLLSRRLEVGKTYYYEFRFYGDATTGSFQFDLYEEYYPDVSATTWFYDAVNYVSYFGFMTGYQSGNFGPADNLQRQDFVVTLARIAGADLTPYLNQNGGLSDVKVGSYYAPAVAWAVDNGIITGYQNGKFGVGDTITREQVCTILYRTLNSPYVDDAYGTLLQYPDYSRVSSFATDAMAWAIQNGIVSGMQNGTLSPVAGASRAQIATIIMRMDQNGMF